MNVALDLPWTSLRSDGALNARGYAIATLPAPLPTPVPEAERVVFVDPRRTATTPTSERRARPRAPEQMLLPEPPTGIELPDGRPLTKAQRVWVDPEVIARWKAEARQDVAGSESDAPRG